MADKGKSKPVHRIRAGALELAVRKNEGEKGPWSSVTATRRCNRPSGAATDETGEPSDAPIKGDITNKIECRIMKGRQIIRYVPVFCLRGGATAVHCSKSSGSRDGPSLATTGTTIAAQRAARTVSIRNSLPLTNGPDR
jgi:hypothetical protein